MAQALNALTEAATETAERTVNALSASLDKTAVVRIGKLKKSQVSPTPTVTSQYRRVPRRIVDLCHGRLTVPCFAPIPRSRPIFQRDKGIR